VYWCRSESLFAPDSVQQGRKKEPLLCFLFVLLWCLFIFPFGKAVVLLCDLVHNTRLISGVATMRQHQTNFNRAGSRTNIHLQEVFDEISRKHFVSQKCNNLEQFCTILEEAYWDYKDLYATANPELFPSLSLKQFVEQLYSGGRSSQPPFSNFRFLPTSYIFAFIFLPYPTIYFAH